MEQTRKMRIGIIGCGGVANGAHISGLLKLSECEIVALCDIDPNALRRTADRLGLSEDALYADYKDMIDNASLDAVEICTPNNVHVPIAEYAVQKGLGINIEKPLGMNVAETEHLEALIKRNGVINMMCFSYRFRPAVRFAKEIMDKGLLGEIVNVHIEYLKSSAFMEGRRLDWRFDKTIAGTGVIGDLGAHLIDMAMLLCGDISRVSCLTKTVVKKRKRLDSEEYAPVTTEDYCSFIAELESGAAAEFLITRCALGYVNTIKFDIYGTDGILSLDLDHPDKLGVCIGEVDRKADGLHTVTVPKSYYADQEATFVRALLGQNDALHPSITDGVRCQHVLDALVESSEKGCWVSLKSAKSN